MIRKIIVVGGGSAGFMAALALKTKLPQLQVLVIRSKEIGVIGVGEGSGVPLTEFLHEFLGLPVGPFVRQVNASFKLGTYFLWGSRKRFVFPFGESLRLQPAGLSKPVGYYCGGGGEDMDSSCPAAAMMAEGRIFERGPNGMPVLQPYAYHIENHAFAEFLEREALARGVQVLSDTVRHVRQDERGVTGLDLSDHGRTETADLYVDCSGFGSLLLGKTLQEPFASFKSSLACDRAVIGGWDRTDEPILPYTIAETMNAGWCWQIEHPNRINRGYVYSSAFITDDEAQREFLSRNPKVSGPTRVVKFISGRHERTWVKNVVAIGNAGGFVEPLEATGLPTISLGARLLAERLDEADLEPRPGCARLFNEVTARISDSVRRFLATHYRFNTRLDTPFWRWCREHCDLAGAEPIVEWYREFGPSPLAASVLVDRHDAFGINGYLTTLLGQSVPYRSTFQPSDAERARWASLREEQRARARRAMTVEPTLDLVQRG